MANDAIPILPSSSEPQPFIRTFPDPDAPPDTAPPLTPVGGDGSGEGTTTPPVTAPPTEPAHGPGEGDETGDETGPPPVETEPDTAALPGLDKLALIILVLGLILLADAITSFLNWMLRAAWPGSGSRAKQIKPVAATKALGTYLGTFAGNFDPEVGTNFTQMATSTGLLSRTLVALATRLYHVAEAVARLQLQAASNVDTTNALRHRLQSQGATQVETVRELQRQIDREQAAEQQTQRRLHALERHVTTILEPELERLRKQIPELKQGQATTVKRVAQHDTMLGLDAMVATVAMAMAKLGTTWTRCDTNRQLGENVCRDSDGLLKALLANALPILAAGDLCGMAAVLEGTLKLLQPAMLSFVSVENALIGCHGNVAPPDWRIAALSRTPVHATVTL
jgi:hypothetical protein